MNTVWGNNTKSDRRPSGENKCKRGLGSFRSHARTDQHKSPSPVSVTLQCSKALTSRASSSLPQYAPYC